jgi:hypothetical protein
MIPKKPAKVTLCASPSPESNGAMSGRVPPLKGSRKKLFSWRSSSRAISELKHVSCTPPRHGQTDSNPNPGGGTCRLQKSSSESENRPDICMRDRHVTTFGLPPWLGGGFGMRARHLFFGSKSMKDPPGQGGSLRGRFGDVVVAGTSARCAPWGCWD